jgi:hypothetical protein
MPDKSLQLSRGVLALGQCEHCVLQFLDLQLVLRIGLPQVVDL